MKNLQNRVRSEAYKLLQNLMFRKTLNEGVKRAVRVRLQAILENELFEYRHWTEHIKHKQAKSRQKEIERKFNKRIQAFKITIHALTPFFERSEDIPSFVVRKDKKDYFDKNQE